MNSEATIGNRIIVVSQGKSVIGYFVVGYLLLVKRLFVICHLLRDNEQPTNDKQQTTNNVLGNSRENHQTEYGSEHDQSIELSATALQVFQPFTAKECRQTC